MTDDETIGSLEKALRKSTTEAAVNGRDLKRASKDWKKELGELRDQLASVNKQLDKLVEERWKLIEEVSLYKRLNGRYSQLAGFILFCAINASPEENILETHPERFLHDFDEFGGTKEFSDFIVKAAVILGLNDAE